MPLPTDRPDLGEEKDCRRRSRLPSVGPFLRYDRLVRRPYRSTCCGMLRSSMQYRSDHDRCKLAPKCATRGIRVRIGRGYHQDSGYPLVVLRKRRDTIKARCSKYPEGVPVGSETEWLLDCNRRTHGACAGAGAVGATVSFICAVKANPTTTCIRYRYVRR